MGGVGDTEDAVEETIDDAGDDGVLAAAPGNIILELLDDPLSGATSDPNLSLSISSLFKESADRAGDEGVLKLSCVIAARAAGDPVIDEGLVNAFVLVCDGV